jgi:hypothetical protein
MMMTGHLHDLPCQLPVAANPQPAECSSTKRHGLIRDNRDGGPPEDSSLARAQPIEHWPGRRAGYIESELRLNYVPHDERLVRRARRGFGVAII